MTTDDVTRIEALERTVGYAFPDRPLALTALTHKSWVNENRDAGCQDNERLEFLGDAVLDLAVSVRLMEALPRAREGELSRLRASLVSTEALAVVSERLGLGELLRLGRGEELTGGRRKPSLLANSVESVVGAIYLADGYEAVLAFVDRHVLSGMDFEQPANRDYKTRLQELSQARLGAVPRYRVVDESGPDHEKVFTVRVTAGETVEGRGRGRNKKEAEQAAALEALRVLEAQEAPSAPEPPEGGEA